MGQHGRVQPSRQRDSSVRSLQALVIHDEALDQILLEVGGGPLAEVGTAWLLHPVVNGHDQVEVESLTVRLTWRLLSV